MAWEKIGSVRESKKGGYYLKIDSEKEVVLGEGDVLQLQDPRKKLDQALESGRLDADKVEEIKSKIPDWIIYDVVLPPKN